MRNFCFALLALVVALTTTGCLSPTDKTGHLRHEKITVKSSPLNWVQIAYTPAPGSKKFPHPASLYFSGSGAVQVKVGPSPQVMSDWTQKTSDPDWNHIIQDSVDLSPEDMVSVFQLFVDEGLIPTPETAYVRKQKTAPTPPLVAASGNLDNNKFKRTITDNFFLVDIVEDILETNFQDALRQSAVWPARKQEIHVVDKKGKAK